MFKNWMVELLPMLLNGKLRKAKNRGVTKYKKAVTNMENSKMWQRFKDNAPKLLVASTSLDVLATTALLGASISEPKSFASFYAYAFAKDLFFRPLQGLTSKAIGNKELERYVIFYYVVNVLSAFLYPILPIESYIAAFFVARDWQSLRAFKNPIDKDRVG
ncbi:MAG: hypothetical protein D6769_01365 [Methanobacteriota archaeon]|nr:MAG: hypothetical protein D6769_01365 [Euryarchaeota archaeon]